MSSNLTCVSIHFDCVCFTGYYLNILCMSKLLFNLHITHIVQERERILNLF